MTYFYLYLAEIAILFLLNRTLNIYLVSILSRSFKNKKILMYFVYVFYLPSVVFHESAHYLVAKFLFLRVKNVRLIPKLDGDKYLLGSVRFEDGGLLRNFLAGSAPFWVGNLFLFFIVSYFLKLEFNIILWTAYIFFIFQLSNTIVLSWTDIKVAWPVYILLATLILLEITGIIKVNLGAKILIEFFSAMDKYLLIPMTVNGCFGIILAVVYKYG